MTIRQPRVIFFISAFFPFQTGATYSAFRLAQSLRRKGVTVEWVVDDRDGTWLKGGRFEGFTVRSFPLHIPGKLGKIKAVFDFTRYLWFQRKQFDIFHVHGGGHMNVLLAGWVRLLCPSVHVVFKSTLDGWDTPDGLLKDKYGRLLLWICRHFDGIVAMTSGQLGKVRVYGCKGVSELIPNGTDCDRYKPDSAMRSVMRETLGIPKDVPVLVYVGWLGERKGTDVLFAVWNQLMQQIPNLYLLTVGDYRTDRDADAELTVLFEEKGLDPQLLNDPRFVRVGHVEDAERYLQASDVFVFPSRSEGFGTVQTEAMACGLPCVVNDLPGVSCDIYPDESVGFRVAGNDVDEFVRIISDLLQDADKQKRIGDAARQRVIDHFSSGAVAERYLELYKKVLQ